MDPGGSFKKRSKSILGSDFGGPRSKSILGRVFALKAEFSAFKKGVCFRTQPNGPVLNPPLATAEIEFLGPKSISGAEIDAEFDLGLEKWF